MQRKTRTCLTIGAVLIAAAGSMPLSADTAGSVSQLCEKETIECQIGEAGVVIGKVGTTNGYETTIAAAASKFNYFFGAKAPGAAVVLGDTLSTNELALVRKEFSVVLPWVTQDDKTKIIRASVRSQIRTQRPDLEGAALDALVEKSLKATLQATGGGTSHGLNQGAVAHELGHLYFIRTFWPEDELDVTNVNPSQLTRYGGPGPDWLDEMAAVLLENDTLTESRENLIKRQNAGEGDFKFWSMQDYFGMIHPAFERAKAVIKARQKTAAGRAKGGVVVLSSSDDLKREDGRNPVVFYSQSRAFADYMIEKTGDKRIFAAIARHSAAGGTMAEWLREAGARFGLPATPKALEEDFMAWITTRYGRGSADRA